MNLSEEIRHFAKAYDTLLRSGPVEQLLKIAFKVAQLEVLLDEARKCIRSVENRSIFGVGGDGMTHWYLADELLANIDKALGGE